MNLKSQEKSKIDKKRHAFSFLRAAPERPRIRSQRAARLIRLGRQTACICETLAIILSPSSTDAVHWGRSAASARDSSRSRNSSV